MCSFSNTWSADPWVKLARCCRAIVRRDVGLVHETLLIWIDIHTSSNSDPKWTAELVTASNEIQIDGAHESDYLHAR